MNYLGVVLGSLLLSWEGDAPTIPPAEPAPWGWQTTLEQTAQEAPAPIPIHEHGWPEVWGFVGTRAFFTGSRMAPNGVPFDPLFSLDGNFNLGLIPGKKLYLFAESQFWGQKPGPGITNPHQGNFDFSKREFDLTPGIAWNYFGSLEFRAFAFANNNLNRGASLATPYGYNDGVALENRLYLPGADPYDIGKLSFLSVGYFPSNALIGANGEQYKPGAFARAYLTWDVPKIRSYVFADTQFICETGVKPHMLIFDLGLATRPFLNFQNLEFRLGTTDTYDIRDEHNRNLGYGSIRIQF